MKPKSLLFLFLLIIALYPSSALANGPYIGVHAGLTVPSSSSFVHSISTLVIAQGAAELDNGYAIGGVAGYRFSKFRVEGELFYRNNDFGSVGLTAPIPLSASADGQVSITSFLVNAYYDIELSEKIAPYIGLGVGYSWLSVDLKENLFDFHLIDNETDSCPAGQFLIGTGISIAPQMMIDVGYRYFITGPIAINGLSSADFTVSNYGSHNFMVGARYNFKDW